MRKLKNWIQRKKRMQVRAFSLGKDITKVMNDELKLKDMKGFIKVELSCADGCWLALFKNKKTAEKAYKALIQK